MYKKSKYVQISFEDFGQPTGLHLSPDNRWVQKAQAIPWQILEKDYAKLFPAHTGNVAKTFRMAFGALIIQTKYHFSDVELVHQIQENPYLQYFIGLPKYTAEPPFNPTTLVWFRKRLPLDQIEKINERIIAYNQQRLRHLKSQQATDPKASSLEPAHPTDERRNQGTLTLDATCAPANIAYPQDVQLLNQVRLHAEEIIKALHQSRILPKAPRIYRQKGRQLYLAFAKTKRRSRKKRRRAVHQQLQFIRRDFKVIDPVMTALTDQQRRDLAIGRQIYQQQLTMYQQNTNRIAHRIVSFNQPYVRPIVRGKVKNPTEFGPKIDVSNVGGLLRIERASYEAFNESTDLIMVIERYRQRTGYYPQRVLVDQIYRTRANRRYCKDRHIRMSGPKLGRPVAHSGRNLKIEHQDERDRIQIERDFSLSKRCYSLEKIYAKLANTALTQVGLSILCVNLDRLQRVVLVCLFFEKSRSEPLISRFFSSKIHKTA